MFLFNTFQKLMTQIIVPMKQLDVIIETTFHVFADDFGLIIIMITFQNENRY